MKRPANSRRLRQSSHQDRRGHVSFQGWTERSFASHALMIKGEGGRIDVVVRREGGRALMEVLDDGPGIPEEVGETLFQPFVTTKPGDEGTGLGLAISRRLARGMGGNLTGEAREEGGTRFILELPLKKTPFGGHRHSGTPETRHAFSRRTEPRGACHGPDHGQRRNGMLDPSQLRLNPLLVAGALAFSAGACASDSLGTPSEIEEIDPPSSRECSIPRSKIYGGGPVKDGIPAITDPHWVRVGDPGTEYLLDENRVVGFYIDGEPYAIPLNILWWHEIVNLNLGKTPFSVTHCPLTGSSMAFDRSAAGGAEFGVSGLLFQNNLVMYDRNGAESLWPQMLAGARCGNLDGTALPMVPVMEMEWKGWRTLNPDTRVMPNITGWDRNYTQYPYGGYAQLDNPSVFFPQEVDLRRPPKERGLGISTFNGGLVFPYGVMDELGELVTIRENVGSIDLVVFWSREFQGAAAYHTDLNGQHLTFGVEAGQIMDEETGTIWRFDGLGISGPLANERLTPVAEAFIAYWFAWPTFYPEIRIWGTPFDAGP